MRVSPKAVSIVVGTTVLLSTAVISFVSYTTPSTAQYVPAVGWDGWIDGTPSGQYGYPGCSSVPAGTPPGSADTELRYPSVTFSTYQNPNNTLDPMNGTKYLLINQVFRNCGPGTAYYVTYTTTKLPGFTFIPSGDPYDCQIPSWQNPAYGQTIQCPSRNQSVPTGQLYLYYYHIVQPPPYPLTQYAGTVLPAPPPQMVSQFSGVAATHKYQLPPCTTPQTYTIPITGGINVNGAQTPDPDMSNNSWSGTLHLVCTPPTSSSSTSPYPPASADVKISPFFTADLVGDEIVITATVKNLGPSLTNNVTLNATIPGLTRIPQNNCNPVSGNPNAYTCPIGTLTFPANAYPVSNYTDTRIHVMKFQMPACATPQYLSIPVSMTVTHSTTDPVPSNNAMSRTLYIWCSPG